MPAWRTMLAASTDTSLLPPVQAWAANIIKSKFEDPLPSEDLKDHFMRGEWDVIMELVEKLPGAKAGKVRTKEGYLKQDRNIC